MDHSTERDGDSISNGMKCTTMYSAWRVSGGEGGERRGGEGQRSCGREREAGRRKVRPK